MSDDTDQISPAVHALRSGLPGIHAWFSLAEEERAVAAVRNSVLAEVLVDIERLLPQRGSADFDRGWDTCQGAIIALLVGASIQALDS
jgi:hypothetical protein